MDTRTVCVLIATFAVALVWPAVGAQDAANTIVIPTYEIGGQGLNRADDVAECFLKNLDRIRAEGVAETVLWACAETTD